ncbi:Hypothetical protein NTJ_13165 [Nesidiocoris tenuis]|uniref:Uncharacterized protein n=1 Tax=Nesidiocoris tenuis TaxID=355587 RepID=A0ABN7B7I7_9HEMI|nr:Hypothetical protein NTJ_13165 [Nesidiocoris tenuis]
MMLERLFAKLRFRRRFENEQRSRDEIGEAPTSPASRIANQEEFGDFHRAGYPRRRRVPTFRLRRSQTAIRRFLQELRRREGVPEDEGCRLVPISSGRSRENC